MFYEFGAGPRGLWDTFSVRNIGLAVQRHMAAKFNGDPENMCQTTSAALAVNLRVDPRRWNPLEQSTFKDFAFVLSLVPDLANWSASQKQALIEIIRAKVSSSESDYLRRLQQHQGLKEAFVKLGSSPPATETKPS